MGDILGSQGQLIQEVLVNPATGKTFLQAVNQNTGGAGFTMTLPAQAGKTIYLCGFCVDGLGATAASVVEITSVGLLNGTIRRELSVPAGVGVAVTPILVEFVNPLIASAVNQAVQIVVPSLGAGNVNVNGWIHGYAI